MSSPDLNEEFFPETPVETILITVSLGPTTKSFTLPHNGTLDDLTLACEDAFDESEVHNWTTHKFIAPPPVGLLKGTDNADHPLAALEGKKLRLLAAKVSEVDALRSAEQSARRRRARRAAAHSAARRHHRHRQQQQQQQQTAPGRNPEEATYTFLQLRPLEHLPHPHRSQAYLETLRADPGIRRVMRRHRFTVGLLTEMDPLEHTTATHEGVGRTLGLNRNQGEVIELRLRTDAGDGYRDYKTIRKTLCHELAHNVHGPHDRHFWDLCHQIEREVDAADYMGHGGMTVGDGPGFVQGGGEGGGGAGAGDEDYPEDHGGWTGGEFVLGGGATSSAASAAPALTRREILAKAAEERVKRMNQDRRDEGSSGGGGGDGAN